MELKFDKKKNLQERLNFIYYYIGWIKKTENNVWSKQQAMLIDSFLENSKNFKISPKEYLNMVKHTPKEKI